MTLDLDPERKLSLAYVPARVRLAVEALWRLDLALGSVLTTGTEPMISRIRLAWWRESLEKLDREKPPGEPVLQAVAAHVLPLGVSGSELALIEEGWLVLLTPERLTREELLTYAEARGARLFDYSAVLLGVRDPLPFKGGRAWALADFARRSADREEAAQALELAQASIPREVWPGRLRPLGMLAALAARDAQRGLPFEQQGSPRRVLRMIGHRLTGR